MDPDYFAIETMEAKLIKLDERITAIGEAIEKIEANVRLMASMMSMSQYRVLNTMIRTKSPVPFNPSH